jgi:hypothetical protein
MGFGYLEGTTIPNDRLDRKRLKKMFDLKSRAKSSFLPIESKLG